MAPQEKSGFLSIGYVENFSTYAAQIRDLCGSAVSYAALGRYVDEQWEARYTTLDCWDADLQPVAPTEPDIAYMLLDTGYVTSSDGQKILGGFTARNPGCGLEPAAGWKGVVIGTRQTILNNWAAQASSLFTYTAVRDFSVAAQVLCDMTGQIRSIAQWQEELEAAFVAARQEGRLGVFRSSGKPAISYFPLPEKDQAGEPLWVVMEENYNPGLGKTWFGLIVQSESELLEQVLDNYCYHLGGILFDSARDANLFLQQLADMAMEEKWTASAESSPPYGILRSYITHTYYRLQEEDRLDETDAPRKIDEVNGKIYFNSGLLTRLFRQIIIVGDRRRMTVNIPGMGTHTYMMVEHVVPHSESDREIASIYDGAVYRIPEIARFFRDYRQVIFDTRLAVQLNDMHIFEDGVERRRLPKYEAEFQACKNNPQAKDSLLARIARDFDSAVIRARLLAERNYKLAVPQFWRETGEIQFLLPIYLGEMEEADKPQCALALALDTSGRMPYYRGATILTLDMAYNNARLIAKPDIYWLNSMV